MTGADLQAVRMGHGLSIMAYGRALGYGGKHVRRKMVRLEMADELHPDVVDKVVALEMRIARGERLGD